MFIWITSHLFGYKGIWHTMECSMRMFLIIDVISKDQNVLRPWGPLPTPPGGKKWVDLMGLWWWNDIRIPKTGKLKLASGKWTLDFEDVWILLKMGIWYAPFLSLSLPEGISFFQTKAWFQQCLSCQEVHYGCFEERMIMKIREREREHGTRPTLPGYALCRRTSKSTRCVQLSFFAG